MAGSKYLTKVYEASKEINIDDSTKIIIFSDCHRGDGSWADDFNHNETIFHTALNYYYQNGFTYMELGDGDELWGNNDFQVIREAHKDTFELMQKFHAGGRLYMFWGNHDIIKQNKKFQTGNLYSSYNRQRNFSQPLFDKLEVYEGILLKLHHTENRIFATHGHQVDPLNYQFWKLARFLVRYLWRPLELLGFHNPTSPAKNGTKAGILEKKMTDWAISNNMLIIAGHTHNPMFPKDSKTPYFNSGCCIHPNGITGIEIQNSEIALIKWSIKTDGSGMLHIEKEILEGPKPIKYFLNGPTPTTKNTDPV